MTPDTMTYFPILSLLIGLPLLAAGSVWLFSNRLWARYIGLGTAGLEIVLAGYLLTQLQPEGTSPQFVERMHWIVSLNAHYYVGVDGVSALFILVTTLLFAGLTGASWNSLHLPMPRLYISLLLTLEAVTIGIFCAQDALLFFLFWELTLIPIYFLLSLWGIGPHRQRAATKYTLFMLTGGILLLFGFLLAALYALPDAGAGFVFDLPILLTTTLPIAVQWPVFLFLLAGFALKTPVVPFHTWLTTVAMEGPPVIAALMTGLKLGAYGIIRIAMPMAPDAANEVQWLLMGFGVIGIIYGALLALVQTNLRRLLAFSSISHVGLVLLAAASLTPQGIQGALLQLLNFPMVAGGLFLMAGFLHRRTDSTDRIHLGGLAGPMPRLATFFLLFGLAGMGLPFTSGFPAEQLMLSGSLQHHTGSTLAAIGGQILGAAYFLHYYRLAFLGPVIHPVIADASDLVRREVLIILLLLIPILLIGLYPNLILDMTRPVANVWVMRMQPGGM